MKNLKKVFLASTLITLILALSASTPVHSIEVTATIHVGTNFVDSTYDSEKGEVFMDNSNGELLIISDSSKTFSTLSMGTSLAGIAYDSGKGEIFVANEKGNTVSVISDTTNNVVATVRVGNAPIGVACDSGKGEVFVTNRNDNTVSVISDIDNTVVATIAVGTAPDGIAYDSGKGEVFVANSNPGNPTNSATPPGTISVISDKTNTVVSTITVDPVPQKMVYDSGKGEIFVINGGTTVTVISDSNNTVIASLMPPIAPGDLAYDSAKGAVFICGYYFGFDAVNRTICVMSDSTSEFLETLSLTPGRSTATGIAYDSALGEVFVSETDGNVYVLLDASLPNVTLSPTAATASPNPSATPTSTASLSPSPTPTQSPSPSPSVPEFPAWIVLPSLFVVGLVVFFRKRRG